MFYLLALCPEAVCPPRPQWARLMVQPGVSHAQGKESPPLGLPNTIQQAEGVGNLYGKARETEVQYNALLEVCA